MDKLEKSVRDFEEKLSEAIREKYREQNGDLSLENQERFLQINSVLRFDIIAFYKAYLKSDRPQEYIGRLVHALVDIKLQMFYIGEVDMGLYNTMLYSRGYDADNPTPYAAIKKIVTRPKCYREESHIVGADDELCEYLYFRRRS